MLLWFFSAEPYINEYISVCSCHLSADVSALYFKKYVTISEFILSSLCSTLDVLINMLL